MKKLIIWGASGHALVVADIVRLTGEYDLIGFVDNVNVVPSDARFNGLPLFGGKDMQKKLIRSGVSHVIFGFGNCQAKSKLADWAFQNGLSLATAIHPKAVVASGVCIGEGSVVAAGAVLNPMAVIGKNVIINTGATVDHECVIGDAAHICPGVNLAGRVHVGRETTVGIGSSVRDRIKIGARTFIGAGSVVIRDIPDEMLAYGVPAKIVGKV